AYPAFLAAALVATDWLRAPSSVRHLVGTVGCGIALVLIGGFQFAFFLPVVLLSHVVTAPTTRQRAAAVAVGVAAALATALAVLAARDRVPVSNAVELARQLKQPLGPLAGWFGIDLFLTAVAAGWVTLPGAVAGFRSGLGRASSRAERCVAV